jgi:hypothetical protein
VRSGNGPRFHGRVTTAAVAVLIIGATVSIATGDGWIRREWGTGIVVALIPVMIALVLWSRVLGNIRLLAGPTGANALNGRRSALIGSALGVVLGMLLILGAYVVTR